MRKTVFTLFVAFLAISRAGAQTLFRVDNEPFSVAQFVSAFQKNGAAPAAETGGFKEYLPLYIASKLKIKEAKRLGLDTLPQLVSELENLRQQIIPAYLVPESEVEKLVNEAFLRGQKDIHLAHIFISSTPDSNSAKQKAAEAYKRLQKGVQFADVAKQFSEDPSAKTTGGDVGFVTVFTLPYALENLLYATPAGKVSPIYQSKNGYHIFLNKGERKAVGEINAAQILIAFPPALTDTDKTNLKKLADSLYNRIQQGDDFGALAKAFSNDASSAPFGGVLPHFTTGSYDALFEAEVLATAPGAVSKPFATQHGWHIVKRFPQLLTETTLTEKVREALREKVLQNDRINIIKEAQVQQVMAQAPMSKLTVPETTLWNYTESAVQFSNNAPPPAAEDHLFLLGSEKITLPDWITFAQENRTAPDGKSTPFSSLFWNRFVPQKAADYYQHHLEHFNVDFKDQITELEEGSLFFEVMQQQVWTPAEQDTAALLSYFTKHRANYVWNKSADAIIFYSTGLKAAEEAKKSLEKAPNRWRQIVAAQSEKLAADSGRFNLDALPNAETKPIKKGSFTAPVVASGDSSTSFAFIVNVYNNSAPRRFSEAKGLVISDYQKELENTWVEGLKKRYKVVVNQKVWTELLKQQ